MVAPDPDNTQELREAAHAYLAAFPVACPQADRLRKALTDNTQDIGEGVRQLRDELRHARLDTPQAFYVWVNQLRNEIEDRLTALLQPSGDTEQAACDYCQDIPEACNGNDCPSEQQVTEGESTGPIALTLLVHTRQATSCGASGSAKPWPKPKQRRPRSRGYAGAMEREPERRPDVRLERQLTCTGVVTERKEAEARSRSATEGSGD